MILYSFYSGGVRSRLEDVLFDLRTRIKPQTADTSRLAIVTVSQGDIVQIERRSTARVLSFENLDALVAAVQRSKPEAVFLAIPHQDLDYEGERFAAFFRSLAKNHRNLFFANYDLNFDMPVAVSLPDAFVVSPRQNDLQEGGAGTLRLYRREVIRSLPLMSYRNATLQEQLIPKLAYEHSKGQAKEKLRELSLDALSFYRQELRRRDVWDESFLPRVLLNYVTPERFLQVSASDLLSTGGDLRLKGRLVLFGYVAQRPRGLEEREGTYVNTPWQRDGDEESKGWPLIILEAILLQNLLSGEWLHRAPLAINLGQTIVCAVFGFVIWRLSIGLAFIILCALLAFLVFSHSLLFAYSAIYVPLADTIFFTFLATILGAFVRGRYQQRLVTEKLKEAEVKKKLALIHGRFLERFANELYGYNRSVIGWLSAHHEKFSATRLANIYDKALASAEELRDYLTGIQTFAQLRGLQAKELNPVCLDLKPLLTRVVAQFDSLIAAKSLRVDIDCGVNAKAFADAFFLEAILFNLISNAVKYTPDGQSITVRVSGDRASKSYFFWRRFWLVAVCDSGPGIAEAEKEQIFEKFYRIKNEQYHTVKGNGLGLFLSAFFAQKMGLGIGLDSTLGQGSVFSLRVIKGRCR